MKQIIVGLGTLVLLFGRAEKANADLLTINNQGFEDRVLGPGQFALGDIPSWEIVGSGSAVATFYPTSVHFPGGAPEGHNTAGVGRIGFGPVSISQVLSDVLTANTSYTLTVDVGRRLDYPLAPYTVQLLAGGSILSQGTETGISPGEFIILTITYFASADDPQLGQLLQIRLLANDGSGQVNFDDVKLDTAAARVSLSSTSLDFGDQPVGTTSQPQALTLTNTGNATLTISDIATSGDFAETDNCPPSLDPGGSCIINVTFTPMAPGPRNGALTIADNAPDTPQMVSLAGNGT